MSSLDNSREETRRRKNALARVENGSTTDWSRPCSISATRRALRKSSNLPNPGTTVSPYVVLFSTEGKIILLGVMSIAFSCIEIVSFKGYLDSTQSKYFLSFVLMDSGASFLPFFYFSLHCVTSRVMYWITTRRVGDLARYDSVRTGICWRIRSISFPRRRREPLPSLGVFTMWSSVS